MLDDSTGSFEADHLLIERLRAGDDAAFVTLIDRYGASLLRVAMLYVHDPAAAEDVVQETWLGVVRGIDRFEGRSSLKTWLFTILTNRAKRRGERDKRSAPFSALSLAESEDGDSGLDRFFPAGHPEAGHWISLPSDWRVLPEERFESSETLAAIAGAIAALPDAQRAVITLRDVEGWPSDEVRNVLNLTETNQRVLLHRARAKVRQRLEKALAS